MCKKCQGLGYYVENLNTKNDQRGLKLCECVLKNCHCNGEYPYLYFKDDKMAPCPCRKYRLKYDKILLSFKNATIPKRYHFKLFNDFKIKNKHGETIDELLILQGVAAQIVDNFKPGKPSKGLFLWGPSGNGKTLISTIIINELILKYAINARFMNVSYQYFHRLRDTYSEKSIDYGKTKQVLDEYTQQEILLIDDLLIQRNSDWEIEMIYNLIDKRYQDEKITLFTTNKDIKEIKEIYESRIYSRIAEMCIIRNVNAPDYRDSFAMIV